VPTQVLFDASATWRLPIQPKVTWSMSGDMDMPVIGGYFALLMPRMVGGDFEKGLAKLKAQAEK